MIRGTLSLASSEFSWKNILSDQTSVSKATTSSGNTFELHITTHLFDNRNKYKLFGADGKTLASSELDMAGMTCRMDISLPDFPLLYEISYFDKRSFVTQAERIPSYYTVTGERKSFTLHEMYFEHRDFESEIRFEAPKDRVPQAILIASLLFEPPMTKEA